MKRKGKKYRITINSKTIKLTTERTEAQQPENRDKIDHQQIENSGYRINNQKKRSDQREVAVVRLT